MAIRPCSAATVHHAVAFERTIEYLAVTAVTAVTAAYIQHQVFGGIPTVHQNGEKRNFALAQTVEHLRHKIEFGFSIAIRIVGIGLVSCLYVSCLYVHSGTGRCWVLDYRIYDHTMLVATPLSSRHLDAGAKLLVQHRVVKYNVSLRVELHHFARVFPQQAWRQLGAAQIAVRVPIGRIS